MLASVLMPFNIFAETVSGTGPIIGVNVSITDHDHETYNNTGSIVLSTNMTRWQCDQVLNGACALYVSKSSSGGTNDDITGSITMPVYSSDNYIYTYDFVFDADYIGSITFTNSFGATSTKTYYINGSHLTLSSVSSVSTFTISSYSLAKKGTDSLMWMFPIESFGVISTVMQNQPMIDLYANSNYIYPIFQVNSNSDFISMYMWQNRRYDFIFISNINTGRINGFKRMFKERSGLDLADLYVSETYWNPDSGVAPNKWSFYHVILMNTGTSRTINFQFNESFKFIPIYFNSEDYQGYLSTDFALQFGLSNRLLDDLHIIAQGTAGSQQAESDLDSGTNTMQQSIDDIVSIESGYTSDFNSSLENIDFSDPIQSNQGILPAANFVISVFNGLIMNNPLSLLIIIVCVLTIGKRVIGK